jgi:hypothetical protein
LHLIDGIWGKPLGLIAGDARAVLASSYVLDREDMLAAASDELYPFPGEITNGTLVRWQDGSCRKYPKAQWMRKIARVSFVSTVFESLIFLYCRGVG